MLNWLDHYVQGIVHLTSLLWLGGGHGSWSPLGGTGSFRRPAPLRLTEHERHRLRRVASERAAARCPGETMFFLKGSEHVQNLVCGMMRLPPEFIARKEVLLGQAAVRCVPPQNSVRSNGRN